MITDKFRLLMIYLRQNLLNYDKIIISLEKFLRLEKKIMKTLLKFRKLNTRF